MKILHSIRKKGIRSHSHSHSSSSESDKSIHKRNIKSNKDDIIVFIPYCADQINELKRKVAASKNAETSKEMMPFLMDFEDENDGFKSALKDGANDCFLLENISFELDFDVRNMDL